MASKDKHVVIGYFPSSDAADADCVNDFETTRAGV